MAKKIFALVASIVLVVCFSVAVSAAVVTTTTYEGTDVAVNVTVTDLAEGTNVTYYATNEADEVFVDQKKVEAGATSVEFDFVTAFANVDSDVKVGYTAVETADDADITTYTISGEGFTEVRVPTETKSVVLEGYTLGQYMQFDNVTVEAGTATVATSSMAADGKITVVFSALESDVTLKVNAVEIAVPELTEVLDIVDAAAVLVANSEDPAYQGGIKVDAVKPDLEKDTPDETDPEKIAQGNADKAGDRKLTVCGKVGNIADYGIIVSTSAIAEENLRPAAFDAKYTADMLYPAIDKAPDGRFAVQLIDVSEAGSADAFVVAGTEYYTAVYAKTADACYVVPFATPVAAN